MRIWPIMTLLLAGCATVPRPVATDPVQVQILGINDFHGNLEPPKVSIDATLADGRLVKVPAGGVAYLAGAAKALRLGQRYSVTVSAGDMIGASPLVSALFLDEPTIAAMNLVGVDYNAVGNHEFDKGSAELLRMQTGGCEKHTTKTPCAVEPFAGAAFQFLAANVITGEGGTLFPGTAIKDFGPVQIGFIGMTLKETATLVTPAGVAGLMFRDEVTTANAAIPALKAAGADAIVLVIHEGGRSSGGYNDKTCPNFEGHIVPILEQLDPAIDAVVSGHTHRAYVCERPRAGGRSLLLTSAGQYGSLITDIRLMFAPDGTLLGHRAENVIVQGEGFATTASQVPIQPAFPQFAADPATRLLVDRYAAAAAPQAARAVGRLAGPITRELTADREQSAGNLIADAMLAASHSKGAQIAFMNGFGVRSDLVPMADGSVTYGQVFAMQPFGNNLVVKTLTGVQLKSLLEQQFSGFNNAERPNMLLPSASFFFAYDLDRPAGWRVVEMKLDSKPIDPAARYRVAVNNFLASGGDGFSVLSEGTDAVDAGLDLDALEAWLRNGAMVPAMGRIKNLTTKP